MFRALHCLAVSALVTSLSFGAAPASAQNSAPDTLARIKSAHRINVAFSGDSPPFSFVDDASQPAGYSIDVCRRVVARIGSELGIADLPVNWLVGSVAERLAMIAAGKADIDCANTSESLSRLETVDFSNRIFIDAGGLLVKADSRIDRLADLANRRIGVIKGTTTETRLNEMLKDRGVNATVVTVREGPEGSAMLGSGSLDAFASDKIKLVGLAATAANPDAFRMLADDISFEPYALAIARGDAAMRLSVNRTLSRLTASGEIDAIFKRWMGKLGRPGGLLAAMYLLNTIPQ